MAWTDIPTRTSSDLNAAADVNALMDNCDFLLDIIIDIIMPIGSFYTQYPSAETNTKATAFPSDEEPAELFGGTWVQLYEDEGIGFKTEGDPLTQTDGENNNRTNGLQTDMMQGHWHALYSTGVAGIIAGAAQYYWDGSVSKTTSTNGGVKEAKTDGTNGTSRTGKETRGRNRLMKIWKRTA